MSIFLNNTEELRTQCKEFLNSKGFILDKEPSKDSPYFRFKDTISGKETSMVFAINEGGDVAYVRVVATGLGQVNNSIDSLRTLIDKISSQFKIGKAILVDNDILLSAECFVYSLENVKQLYERMYIVLRQMCETYYHTLENSKTN